MAPVERSPIRIQKLLNLIHVAITPENVINCDLTKESDNYIYVHHFECGEDQLVCIDISKPTKPVRKPFDFDYLGWTEHNLVIVNLHSNVLARRVERRLRILKLESDTKREIEMKAHTMREDVESWRWINKDTIAVLTETAVYHWKLEGNSEPVKVFDRQVTFKHGEFGGYTYDHSLKWLVLSKVSEIVCYESQLYSVDRKLSRIYEGYLPGLTELKLEHNSEPSVLFCYVSFGELSNRLHICEVGEPAQGDRPYAEKVVELSSAAENYVFANATYDEALSYIAEYVPFALLVSQKFNIIYIINYAGNVHLYDFESGDCIYSYRESIGQPILSVYHEATSRLVVVARFGRVLTISIDEEKIIHHVRATLKNPELARRLASRWNLTGHDEILPAELKSSSSS